MELMSIFVNEETKEGLYAIRYEGEEENEFRRLLNCWADPEYIGAYLEQNKEYLNSDFFKRLGPGELGIKLYREVKELRKLFIDAEELFHAGELKLREVFWPLSDLQIVIPIHQKTKASIKEWRLKRSLIRLYAIRISENAYIITGGAIKIVRRMEDHPDTKKELEKMARVKAFLESVDLYNEEDLKLFVL